MTDKPLTINATSSSLKLVVDGISVSAKPSAQMTAGDAASLVIGSVDSATLSITSKQLSNLYSELGKISDPESAAKAKAAFRSALMNEIDSPGNDGPMEFVLSMNELAKSDSESFQETFITASALTEGGYDTTSFLNTVIKLEESDLQSAFVTETNSIINDKLASTTKKEALFDEFIDTVSGAIDESLGTDDYTSNMSDLFEQLGQREDLDDKISFLDQYTAHS